MNSITMAKKSKNKHGRPSTSMDWNRIEKMAMAGSNGVQIAAAIGVHYDTLANHCEKDKPCGYSLFSDYLRAKREKGNDLLLRKQYDIAMSGDKSMLIWLGKNRLGQVDKKEVKEQSTRENFMLTKDEIAPKYEIEE